jgi:thioredoxin
VLAACACATRDPREAELEARFLGPPVPVLVDMTADWCMPCRQQAPIIEKLHREGGGAFEVVEVDVDEHEALAVRYGVETIPTLIIFCAGREHARFTQLTDEQTLREALEDALGTSLTPAAPGTP